MRLPDWRKRLRQEIKAARSREWKWWGHDCCYFGALCNEAVTGKSALERMIGFQYRDAKGAALLVKEHGLRTLIERELGIPVKWTQCGEGDLVLCEGAEDSLFNCILTVHDGAQLLAPAEKGLKRIPMTLATVGWRFE